jgi:hypothetical protein
MKQIQTFFKTSAQFSKTLSFGKFAPQNFNYVKFYDPKEEYINNRVVLNKQFSDSFSIFVEFDNNDPSQAIEELKITSGNLISWEDYWIDPQKNILIDPAIERINLQKNDLVHANFNLSRKFLKHINLEGNLAMKAVFIHDSPNLEVLNLSNCPALSIINLGNNRNIKALSARNCNMSSEVQERLLRDFRPTLTSSSNISGVNLFRKKYETVLDLRGNDIDWGNYRVASKIRLLLCNNWLVLWDTPPPVSIIPIQMYAFFTNNLEENLIKEYYG